MNKLLVSLSPVQLHHKIYVIQDGVIIKQVNATNKQLSDVINALLKEYSIDNVTLSGAKAYTAKFGANLKVNLNTEYSNAHITIDYV